MQTWQNVWAQGVSIGWTNGWRHIWHIKSSSTSPEIRLFLSELIFSLILDVLWTRLKLLISLSQCYQEIFLKNHGYWTKKERKKRAKKPKKTEKKRVFTLKILIFWPPLCFLLHFYALIFFRIQKLENIFKKILNLKFNYSVRSIIFEKILVWLFEFKKLCIFWQIYLFFEQK